MREATKQGQQRAALEVARRFELPGPAVDACVLARGHIHNSYVISCDVGDGTARFLFQQINDRVFREPHALMRNLERVTTHLVAQAQSSAACLRLLPTTTGGYLQADDNGAPWRAFYFIEGSTGFTTVSNTEQAFDVGQAFGRFQRQLLGLDVRRLVETIPDFHDTAQRYRQFSDTRRADRAARSASARREIEFAETHRWLVGELQALIETRQIPTRIVHNDAKLDNVLFDADSGRALCVVDLDTVMPGFAFHDFGDLVRTGSGVFKEDESDLAKVALSTALFKSLALGFLSESHDFLTAPEIRNLVFAAKLITFETGLRFLTDYLDGDIYFQVNHAAHNLARCRVQFRLLESIENNEGVLHEIIADVLRELR